MHEKVEHNTIHRRSHPPAKLEQTLQAADHNVLFQHLIPNLIAACIHLTSINKMTFTSSPYCKENSHSILQLVCCSETELSKE